jgi:hypothetical protein
MYHWVFSEIELNPCLSGNLSPSINVPAMMAGRQRLMHFFHLHPIRIQSEWCGGDVLLWATCARCGKDGPKHCWDSPLLSRADRQERRRLLEADLNRRLRAG